VSRVVYGAFIVFTTAFVLSIAVQVIPAVYTEPSGSSASSGVGRACADGLRELARASEAARLEASRGRDRKEAARAFEDGRRSAWSRHAEIARICEGDPRGIDALAAVYRFDRAAEADAVRQVASVGRVRRQVESFIRMPE